MDWRLEEKYKKRIDKLKEKQSFLLKNNNVKSSSYLNLVNENDYEQYARLDYEIYHLEQVYKFYNRKNREDKEHLSNRGGYRYGSGRKTNLGLGSTVTVRIPQIIKPEINAFIDLYAIWLSDDSTDRELKRKSDDKSMRRLFSMFEAMKVFYYDYMKGRKLEELDKEESLIIKDDKND